ncbi:hypothetical protein [Neobacillus sp. LXY-4]|uniref:hypothetical protein n=1 Tax=Neobacillus sp. LXY-4 TaxID=3379826 RepID=UPI003EDEFA21
MYKKRFPFSLLIIGIILIAGCSPISEQLIANRNAEAVLTKKNELQFRFKIHDAVLADDQTYKVKVSIHHEELAQALGTKELIYGEDIVYSGEYLEAAKDGETFILMNPISLKKDLHPFEIEKMIVKEQAITVEVFNDEEILGKALLTKFSTEL